MKTSKSTLEFAAGIAAITQADTAKTGRPGRPSIHGTPMTAAQRKARSRALTLGALAVDLDNASKLANDWAACMTRGRPGATDKDIEDAFKELAVWIARAQLNIPHS